MAIQYPIAHILYLSMLSFSSHTCNLAPSIHTGSSCFSCSALPVHQSAQSIVLRARLARTKQKSIAIARAAQENNSATTAAGPAILNVSSGILKVRQLCVCKGTMFCYTCMMVNMIERTWLQYRLPLCMWSQVLVHWDASSNHFTKARSAISGGSPDFFVQVLIRVQRS